MRVPRSSACGEAVDVSDVSTGVVVRRQDLLGQVRAAQNASEQVVEVVRDAASEHTQAVQLLSVLELRFELLARFFGAGPLGDVANDANQRRRLAFIVAN